MHRQNHTCRYCARSFKRAEHLTRHLRTRGLRYFFRPTLLHLRLDTMCIVYAVYMAD